MNEDHEDFIVDGFPQSLNDAVWFEEDVSEPRFIVLVREQREKHPEVSESAWEEYQKRILCLKEYYSARHKWIEIVGESEDRSLENVIQDIDKILV